MVLPVNTKFSTFADGGDLQVNDIVVGLRNGINTKFLNTTVGSIYLPLAGGAMTGAINMQGNFINNLLDPVLPQDAATRAFVLANTGSYLPINGGTMGGNINMAGFKVTGGATPTAPSDYATKLYVDSGSFLPLLGGTMLGQIDMGNQKIINLGNPTSAQDAVTVAYLSTSLGSYLLKSGGTMTGAINMGGYGITSLLDPVNPQDAATKNYVDTFAAGLNVQQSCRLATTGALTANYNNGASGIGATLTNSGALAALTVDSVAVNTNDRILVRDQATTYEQGIYVVTNAGSGAVNWVLTRATDYDQPSEIQKGDLVIINEGTQYAGSSFVETVNVSAVGTDPILWSQFTYSATSVLLKAMNLSDVANTTTAFNNISPVTTKGDIIVRDSTNNIRLGVGADGTLLQANSATASGLQYTTATYPTSTVINQILYSSSTNIVAGLATANGSVLVTDNTGLPSMLANPSADNRVLLSGNLAIPAWSTASYPPTTTINRILYSSANNTINEIVTANSATLYTNSSGVPAFTASMTNGQILIGSTGGSPTLANLTAGTGVTITNGAGSITINASASGTTDMSSIFLLMGC